MKFKTLKKVPETALEGTAKEHWDRVVPPFISAGVVKEIDVVALEIACELYARYREEDNIPAVKQYLDIMGRFGVTPKGRESLKMKTEEKKPKRDIELSLIHISEPTRPY